METWHANKKHHTPYVVVCIVLHCMQIQYLLCALAYQEVNLEDMKRSRMHTLTGKVCGLEKGVE